MASILPVLNETKSILKRTTQDGRELLYELEVIQQPERARACGSGAKSSADRRPVDPPPVVELRIYEGLERKDVTFSYNANFFLFTTLEHARAMAPGRVTVTQNITPVLTGMPVAGMAYLDRPKAAGYFIFPDLSVRHEGKYRLSFNLYEEPKESKNADLAAQQASPSSRDKFLQSNPMAPRAHFHYRSEVKSEAFDVYSAKKFPGLSESTTLSRLVAEQGCRVRIRRDVRMRRRDKGHEKYPDMDDESLFARSERFSTPQQSFERPRSISHGSMEVHTPYSTGRPPSVSEMGYFQPVYQQPSNPTSTQLAGSYQSHLSFGGSNTPHYQTPSITAPPLLPSARQAHVQQSNSFEYASPVHTRQMSAPQSHGFSPVAPQQFGPYSQPTSLVSENQAAAEYRRASTEFPTTRQQLPANLYPQNHQPTPQQQYIQQQSPLRSLTPISTSTLGGPPPSLPSVTSLIQQTPLEPKAEPIATEISAMPQGPQNPFSANCVPAQYSQYSPNTPQMLNQYQSLPPQSSTYFGSSSPHPTEQGPASQPKRSYGSVFDASHIFQPMHGGMRPDSSQQGKDVVQIATEDGILEDDTDYEAEVMKPLIYKRADGTRQAKKCPSPRVRSVWAASGVIIP